MGLVGTSWRLAEDMHRRGEASEGTLPKATRRARKRVRSPHRAGAEVLPMWECSSSNVANSQLGIEIGSCGSMAWGELVWYTTHQRKEN